LGFLKAFGAFYDDKPIGARLELCFRDVVYDWYAGSDLRYKNRYPNDYLPYNIMLWGKDNGYRLFDFGGAGKPGVPYGVRDHKIKFGGDMVEFGRFQKVNDRVVYKLAEKLVGSIKPANK